MKKSNFLIMLLAALAVVSCSDEDLSGGNPISEVVDAPKYTKSISLSTNEEKANEAINDFSFDLFNKICTSAEIDGSNADNQSISPLSVEMSLGILLNTCDEATAQKVVGTLNLPDLQTYSSLCNKLLRFLPNSENGAELVLANSAWFDNGYVLSSDYVKNINKLFYSEVYSANFSDSSANQLINNWISRKTNNKITNFLDLNLNNVVSFINTLYLKGAWQKKFSKDKTEQGVFHGTSGDETAQMMWSYANRDYFSLDDCAALSFYFVNKKTEMIFVLPNEDVDFKTFCDSFSNKKLNQLLATREQVTSTVTLPKFSVTNKYDIQKTLNQLGIPMVMPLTKAGIDDEMSFSVSHEVVSSIDEDGATVVAASSANGNLIAAPLENISLNFDRPFVYLVRNVQTGSILLLGRICNF